MTVESGGGSAAARLGDLDTADVPSQATHTSEDNASFNELQDKAVEDHKRRYHWAYDADPARGDPKLHLLADGSWISKERRLLADAAVVPKGVFAAQLRRKRPSLALTACCTAVTIGPKDDRPSAPETWTYRARNPLLFPPELETTRAICGVGDQAMRVIQREASIQRLMASLWTGYDGDR